VGDSKALPILGGVMLVLLLPLIIVLALIIGFLSGMDSAAAQCTTTSSTDSSFAWPTDKHEIDEDWSDPDSEGNSHSGVDFEVNEGSKVYAAADGKVTSISGNTVVIQHDQNVETHTKYFHDIKVKAGDQVKRGQQIGTSGSGTEGAPGLSGAHVHFELWVDQKNDGKLVNTKLEENPFGDAAKPGSDGGSCCANGDLSGANNQQKAFNFFVQNGFTKEQAAGIVGNMISESSVEPGRKEGTNPGTVTNPSDVVEFSGGWGIVQWTPAGKMIKPSRQAGVDDATIASLAYQLDFLRKQLLGQGPLPEKAAGDATKAAKTVEDAAIAFGGHFERFAGYENPNNPRYAERKANARHVFDTFAGSAPAQGPGDSSGCGAGSGNIAEVAKNLAWPEDGHDGTDASLAKPEYRDALKKYNDPGGYLAYTDCGRFVSTVMHMSGADPKYPAVSTDVQFDYLQSSGKYDGWHGEPPGGMKPGDILNGPGHTYLYVGPWGKGNGYNAAAGSLGDHVPEAGHLYGVGGQFWVFRLKSAPQAKS
jgi:hypothetical protein